MNTKYFIGLCMICTGLITSSCEKDSIVSVNEFRDKATTTRSVDLCYEDEGAWSEGERYTMRGNWATYTPYEGAENTVILFAGQTTEAGTVHFSEELGGEVVITITLDEGFLFYEDPDEENVKIQGYETAPAGNPSPGRFVNKSNATESPYSVTVETANFFGIHVDVMREVPCPEE